MSICAFGRKRRNANSDGVESTVSPIERSRMSNTLRTCDQSQRAGDKGSGVSRPGMASVSNDIDISLGRRTFIGSFFDRRVVDEHYGNVVADWINALAFDAFQRGSIRLQLDF